MCYWNIRNESDAVCWLHYNQHRGLSARRWSLSLHALVYWISFDNALGRSVVKEVMFGTIQGDSRRGRPCMQRMVGWHQGVRRRENSHTQEKGAGSWHVEKGGADGIGTYGRWAHRAMDRLGRSNCFLLVIVSSKRIKSHSKVKRRAPAYSRPRRRISGVVQKRYRSNCQKGHKSRVGLSIEWNISAFWRALQAMSFLT